MNLLGRIRGQRELNTLPLGSIDDLATLIYNGVQYPTGLPFTQRGTPRQTIENNFEAYVAAVHTRHGVVAAAVIARALLLSSLVFKYRNVADGAQAQLFGTQALRPLEQFVHPLTRERALMLAETHASYSGCAYVHTPPGGRTRILRPDRMSLIVASEMDADTPADQLDGELVAYFYSPDKHKQDGTILPVSEVAQWAPEPHPLNPWIGQSWVTSVVSEITGDEQISEHSNRFYTNAATPNLIFSYPVEVAPETIKAYAEQVNKGHAGPHNAGKNLFIGHGADVEVVGSRLSELNLRDTQGGYETRIASRARVPATVLGIREGMQGSSLNAGNYNSARRMWADGWFTPTAQGLCSAIAHLVDVPNDAELTFDPARVMFLQEDRKDEAEVQEKQAGAIRQLIDGGFDPETVVAAVNKGNWSLLKHTGNLSVQLQPPGTTPADPPQPPPEPQEEP